MPMPNTLIPKNLVRWRAPGEAALGTVLGIEAGRVTVRFDDGEERQFVWPSEVLERATFDVGQHVRILADDEVGVVQVVFPYKGLILYKVGLPGGSTKTVPEDGVRPAV